MPADPNVFAAPKAPRTISPTQLNGIGNATPAPTPPPTSTPVDAGFTPPPPAPVIRNADGTTTNGTTTSTGQTVKAFDPNDPSTYTVRKNADGSTDYIDLRGQVVQHSNPPTGAPGAAGTTPAAGTGTGGAPAAGTGGSPGSVAFGLFDLSGSTTPAPVRPPGPATPQEQADITAYQKEISDAMTAYFNANGKYPDATTSQTIISAAEARHPLAVAFSASNSNDPNIVAASNNQNLINRITNQTSGDTARLSAGGAAAQTQLTAAANQATATGVGAYADANAAANAARTLGANDLSLAVGQGNGAINTADAAADPLMGLANFDVGNGNAARDTASAYSAATGMSLQDAQAAVARLTALSQQGDVQATKELEQFRPSTATAGVLSSFSPTATQTAGFNASAGTAPQLAAMNTNTAATGQLASFGGSAGTAPQLAQAAGRTGVSSTQDLLNFEGNTGTADQLSGLNTNVDTSKLTNFQGVGQNELSTLNKIATGADVGPSAAEALLRKNADINESQALALARSGRGAGENANNLKQAIFQNSATEQGLGNDMAALRAQEAATARGQNIQAASTAAGTATTIGGQQLSAQQAAVQSAQQSVANKITALTQSGAMTQKQADQMLSALQSGQQGQLQSVSDQIQALTASGQLSQGQAGQVLDAIKAAQAGQQASVAQQSTNVANAGQQMQTQSAQQLSALQSQQQADLTAANTRMQALVASGQMTQAAAAQQLQALQNAQQGELALKQLNLTAASSAATGATNIATVNSDLAKAFSNIGLSYDVNSGNVMNNAGQIVMTGQQVNSNLVNAGLNAQVGQGQIGASVTNQGVQALTQMTNTSVDAQKASATLGFQTAAAITSLSQAELSQLQGIIQNQDAMALQKWATEKNIALQVDAANAQQTGAIFSALGTIVAGAAVLSDVRAKTDIAPMGADDWLKSNGMNLPKANEPPTGGMVNNYLLAPATAQPQQPVSDNSAKMSGDKLRALLSMGGAFGGLAGKGIGTLSDEKSKKDKKPESFEEWLANMPAGGHDSPSTDFREAKGYSYEYKNPGAAGAEPGKQYGPMAQDLKKTAAGDAVSQGPNGLLSVDPHKTIMPMMAAMGEQQRRIDIVEHTLKQLLSKKGV